MNMHGQYFKLLEEPHINKKLSILWLSNSHLKRKTESDLCAIQDQAITTKYIEKHIYKSTTNSTCRLCKTYDETIHHIISGCPTIAPTLYLNRHNNLAKYIYIKIANQHNLNTTNKWYNYEPPRVLENEKIKLLWDFSIQTDKTVNANKPDIIIINKQQQETTIIDIAVPNDNNIMKKRSEKIDKYTNLAIEIKELWNMKNVQIVPIIIGVNGIIHEHFTKDLNRLHTNDINVSEIQKIVLLGTAYIIHRFFTQVNFM